MRLFAPLLLAVAHALPMAWTDLAVLDCNGGLHLAQGTPAQIDVALPFLPFLAQQFQQQVAARAACAGSRCAYTPTPSDLLTFFMPSVPGLLNALQPPAAKARLPARCQASQSATDGLPAFGSRYDDDSSMSLLLSLLGMDGPKTMPLPTTCSYASYMAGNACNLTMQIPNTGSSLLISVDSCPAPAPLPYVSVSCSGAYCASLFAPCTTSADCGAAASAATPLTCQSVFPASDSGSSSNLMLYVLTSLGLVSSDSDLNSCAAAPMSGSNALLRQVRAWYHTITGRPAPDTAPTQVMGMCMPTSDGLTRLLNGLSDQFTPTSEVPYGDATSVQCQAGGCALQRVGNGVCNMECYTAECHWDGNDCGGAGRTAVPVVDRSLSPATTVLFGAATPAAMPANYWEPCNGWGSPIYAWTGSGYATLCPCAYQYGGAYNPSCNAQCSNCTRPTFQPYTVPPTTTVLTGAAAAFSAWDGLLPALPGSPPANAADRKSGAAFYTPSPGGAPAKGIPAAWDTVFSISCTGDISLRALNPNLGLAFSMPALQGLLGLGSRIGRAAMTCVASARGVSALSAAQYELRAQPWHLAPWAYLGAAFPAATLGRLQGGDGAGLGSQALSTLLLGLFPGGAEPANSNAMSDQALAQSSYASHIRFREPSATLCSLASASSLGSLAAAAAGAPALRRNCSISYSGLSGLLGVGTGNVHVQVAQDVCAGASFAAASASAAGAAALPAADAADALPSAAAFWEGPMSGVLKTPTACSANADCLAFGTGVECVDLDAALFGGLAGLLPPRMMDLFSWFVTGRYSVERDGGAGCGGSAAFLNSLRAAVLSMGPGGSVPPPATPGAAKQGLSFCFPRTQAIANGLSTWANGAFSGCTGPACLSLPSLTPTPAGPAIVNYFFPLPIGAAAPTSATSAGAPATSDPTPAPPPPNTPQPFTSSFTFVVPGPSAITAGQLETIRSTMLKAFSQRGAAAQPPYTPTAITFPSVVVASDGSTTITTQVALPPSSTPAQQAALTTETGPGANTIGGNPGPILASAGIVNAAAASAVKPAPAPGAASGGLSTGALAGIAAGGAVLLLAVCAVVAHSRRSAEKGIPQVGTQVIIVQQHQQQHLELSNVQQAMANPMGQAMAQQQHHQHSTKPAASHAWVRHVDGADIWWHNTVTNESSWTEPAGMSNGSGV